MINFANEFKRAIDLANKNAVSNGFKQVYLAHILLSIVKPNGHKCAVYEEINRFGMINDFVNAMEIAISKIDIRSESMRSFANPVTLEDFVVQILDSIVSDFSNTKPITSELFVYKVMHSIEDKQTLLESEMFKNIRRIDRFHDYAKKQYEKLLTKNRESKQKGIGLEDIIDADQKNAWQDIGQDEQDVEHDVGQKIEEYRFKQENRKQNENYKMNSERNNTPALSEFSKDLTAMARAGKLDPVVSRDVEIKRAIQILTKRLKSNPILIGDPGVGKTAVVEGIAQKVVENQVPKVLQNKRIVLLDVGSIIAGTKYRGEFEDRIKKILREAQSVKNVIFFIDEIHSIIGAGSAEGSLDASNIIKPSLSRGELQIIGATTLEEYRKYFERDSALTRRFQPIIIREPSREEAITILQALKKPYEAHHNVIYTQEAIVAAVDQSIRYITDRFLPDKAIDLIDEAASNKRVSDIHIDNSLEEKRIEKKIKLLIAKKNKMAEGSKFEDAAKIRDQIKELSDELKSLQNGALENQSVKPAPIKIQENDINEVISQITSISLAKIEEEESQKLLSIEGEIKKFVIGQDEAINLLANSLRRARTGISDERRPMGSFIFLGSTGVGKTLVGKIMAYTMFGSEKKLIRIDMSDYMEKHSVSKLIGAAPGFVGYEESGYLTKAVKNNPYSVVLFDEIEKAHESVLNILLQILEEGEIQDNFGKLISFRNTIIIMTSNLGSSTQDYIGKSIGFGKSDAIVDYEVFKENSIKELKKHLRPELVNRIEDIVVFKPISKDMAIDIASIQLKELTTRVEKTGYSITIDKSVASYLIDKGFDIKYGARSIRRAIKTELEDRISTAILTNELKKDVTTEIKAKKDGLEFIHKKTPVKKDS